MSSEEFRIDQVMTSSAGLRRCQHGVHPNHTVIDTSLQGFRVQPDIFGREGTIGGQRVTYTRVSTLDQNTARQSDGAVVNKTFTDKASGKDVCALLGGERHHVIARRCGPAQSVMRLRLGPVWAHPAVG